MSSLVPDPEGQRATSRVAGEVLADTVRARLAHVHATKLAEWLRVHHGDGPWLIDFDGNISHPGDAATSPNQTGAS